MNETKIVTNAPGRLKETAGIEGLWHFTDVKRRRLIDGTIDLFVRDKKMELLVEAKAKLREYQLDSIRSLAIGCSKENLW